MTEIQRLLSYETIDDLTSVKNAITGRASIVYPQSYPAIYRDGVARFATLAVPRRNQKRWWASVAVSGVIYRI